MVQALTDVMHEVQTEKDSPDSIEELLNFLNGLTADIKVSFLIFQICLDMCTLQYAKRILDKTAKYISQINTR